MEYNDKLLLDFLIEECGLIEPQLLNVEIENSVIYYAVNHNVGIHSQTDEFETELYELLSFVYSKIKSNKIQR